MGYIEDMQRTIRYSGPPKSKHIEALWRGTVTDVRSDGLVRVRIPALGGTASLGPMPTAAAGLAVGHPVLVGAIAGQYAEMMVIGFADGRVPSSGAVGRAVLASETTMAAKTALGLPNVDNTADVDKPVSDATALALAEGLGTKADSYHTHYWDDLVDKPLTFAPIIGTTSTTAKAGNWVPSWSEVTSKPATFAPIIGSTSTTAKAGNWFPTWAEVTGKPTTFAPIVGTGAADAKAGNWVPAWTDVTGKPATFAPSTHTHLWADLTDKPLTFAPSAHSHAATDVASGVLDPARLPAATALAQGAQSAAHWSRVNGATSADTASTLVLRDAAGRAQMANPATDFDLANKNYVDSTAGTGPWVALTLEGTWVPYTGGGHYYGGLMARRDGTSVQIKGMVKNSATATGTTIADLPLDLVPNFSGLHHVVAGTSAGPRQVGYLVVGVDNTANPNTASIAYDTGPTAPTFVSIDVVMPL